jgi:hypothetical protein
MKRLSVFAVALAAIAPSVAMAQAAPGGTTAPPGVTVRIVPGPRITEPLPYGPATRPPPVAVPVAPPAAARQGVRILQGPQITQPLQIGPDGTYVVPAGPSAAAAPVVAAPVPPPAGRPVRTVPGPRVTQPLGIAPAAPPPVVAAPVIAAPPPAVVTPTVTAPAAATSDAAFVYRAAQSAALQVLLGREVLARATTPAILALARRAIDQNMAAGQNLADIGSAEGHPVPNTPSADGRAAIQAVGGIAGPALDREYLSRLMADQDAIVALYQTTAAGAAAPALRAFALDRLAAVAALAADARQLRSTLP